MNHLWKKGAYKGERYNEGFGTRVISFNRLYKETETIIQKGEAANYLYSIKKS